MDGTYGNAFPSNLTPSNQQTPSDRYKTNVNRSKTRKWVEAKVQSYDGDDWGADYDEDEEPAPAPPPQQQRPMGPRQPGGGAASGGPPYRSFQPPLPSAAAGRGGAPRIPSGQPPLHVQTEAQQQQQSPVASPAHATAHPATAPPYGSAPVNQFAGTPPAGSLLSARVPASASASGLYPSDQAFTRRTASPPVQQPQQRASPGPQTQSAGPHPTPGARFLPRNASMGQQDAVDTAKSPRTSMPTSSTPEPSGKQAFAAAEPRSASPANAAGSSGPKSPNKPLPFIRPADIYKRMSEEKERERRSMDSARASMDSVGRAAVSGERPESPAKPAAPSSQQPAVESQSQRVASSSTLRPNPNLTPVQERKSEYGLEGVLASYGDEEEEEDEVVNQKEVPTEDAKPTEPAKLATPAAAEPDKPVAAAPPVQQDSRKEANVSDQRESVLTYPPAEKRMSTSPQLPSLARMSGFGEGLFGTSSFLSESSPMATIKDKETTEPSKPPATSLPPLSTTTAPAATPEPLRISPTKSSSRPNSAAGSPTKSGKVHNLIQAINSRSSSPTKETTAPALASPSTAQQSSPSGATRPDLKTPQEQVPAAGTPKTHPELTKEKENQPLDSPSSIPGRAPETVTTSGDGEKETSTVGEVDPTTLANTTAHPPITGAQPVTEKLGEAKKPDTSSILSPPSLPPPLAKIETSSAQASPTERKMTADASPFGEPTKQATPLSASSSQMIPPLNPRKGVEPPQLEEFSPNLDRTSTMGTSTMGTATSSPVKESDMLREEIIKSLSPSHPSKDFSDARAGWEEPSGAAAGAVRESSYLPDLYDDYWASSDDKADQAPPDHEKPGASVPAVPALPTVSESKEVEQPEAPAPVPVPAPISTSVTAMAPTVPAPEASPAVPPKDEPLQIRPNLASTNDDGPRRFSWEMGSEDVEVPPTSENLPQEPKSLGVELGATSLGVPTVLMPAAESSCQPPAAESTGAMSHQVSQASTLVTRRGDALPEPPSPVSVLSSDHAGQPSASMLPPVATKPSPPLEELAIPSIMSPPPLVHDELGSGESSPASIPLEGTATPIRVEQITILTTRQIMDMPSVEDRIKAYRETREHFGAIDTGLQGWLSGMKVEYPEYADMTGSFASAGIAPSLAGGAPGASQVPSIQPHLMPPPQHHATIHFGHTGAQVGNKSKELFMAAGKAGKGLLSKGRNKLRGTGDKVFS